MPQKHILVIDDDPLMRRLIGGWIVKLEMEGLYASSGDEGREIARRLHPDLILMDYHMPGSNGIETASRIKSEEETKNIPIIFLTNEDLTEEAQKGLKEIGVAEYLHKSVPFEDFSAAVKKILG